MTDELTIADVRTGTPLDWSWRGVPSWIEVFGHADGSLVVFWCEVKRAHVCIDITDMDEVAIRKSAALAVHALQSQPANRAERRAQDADMRRAH